MPRWVHLERPEAAMVYLIWCSLGDILSLQLYAFTSPRRNQQDNLCRFCWSRRITNLDRLKVNFVLNRRSCGRSAQPENMTRYAKRTRESYISLSLAIMFMAHFASMAGDDASDERRAELSNDEFHEGVSSKLTDNRI